MVPLPPVTCNFVLTLLGNSWGIIGALALRAPGVGATGNENSGRNLTRITIDHGRPGGPLNHGRPTAEGRSAHWMPASPTGPHMYCLFASSWATQPVLRSNELATTLVRCLVEA